MIKAILFDFGNVISAFRKDRFLARISRCASKTQGELAELIYGSGLADRHERGEIDGDEFIRQVVEAGGLAMSKEHFIEAFTDVFEPIESTHRLIRALKGRYVIGMVSNTNDLDFSREISATPIFPLFDAVTVSFRVGAMKPDPRIFQAALQAVNRQPEECAFIDDIREFAVAAEKLGIHGIRYASHLQLVRELRNLGVTW